MYSDTVKQKEQEKEIGTICIKKPGHFLSSCNGIKVTDYKKEN
jgi:hypothetical protein